MIRIIKFFFLLLLFCFCHKNLLAQNKTIDSLLTVLKAAKEDTNKVKILNLLSRQLSISSTLEKARLYADSALVLADKLGFRKGKANSYTRIGLISDSKGDYSAATENYYAALEINKEIGDKQEVANVYINLGNTCNKQGNYPEALKNYLASIKIYEEQGNKQGLAKANANIGIIYEKQSNYPEALKNYFSSLKFFEETGDKQSMAIAYVNIGSIYERQGKYPEALKMHHAALKIAEESGNKMSIAASNINIGLVYSNQGNYPEALKKYLLALKNYEYVGSKRGIADAYNKLADIYYWQENYPESLKNYFASLKINEEIGSKEGVALSYYNIGGVYANQDKYEDALKNSRTSLKLYEELGSEVDIADVYVQIASIYGKQGNYPEASKNLLASLKVYEEAGHGVGVATANVSIGDNFLAEAIKNGPAASVKYKQAIQYLHKGLKHATEIGLNETVLRAYESLGEAYKGVNNYKKALEYYSLFVEMKDSLHNNETTRKLEQQRTQYEVEKAVEEEKIKNENALAQQRAEQKRKNELLLSGFVILAIISFFIILLIRQRNQKRRAVEKAEAGHKMAELELQSLRAQLNPHFMFNSLNAIQDLILKEDNDRSHLYLSRFAKLLRMLLDNANQPFVSVKQELEFLELYLSLENLRIPNLQFTIEKDPKMNMEQRMVPNMMLQPYIENAIWHGLSNKKGDRKLRVRIHENGTATEFEIEDNGIGRKKAAEIKERYRQGHHSKGMELLSKRFNLLSKEYGEAIHTSVTDLENNGDAVGTLVKIDVPFTLSKQANQLVNDTNHYN